MKAFDGCQTRDRAACVAARRKARVFTDQDFWLLTGL